MFFDLSKAFDTVSQTNAKTLLYRSARLCLELVCQLIGKQLIELNGSRCSVFSDVTCGVPRGSTLYPLLSIIY